MGIEYVVGGARTNFGPREVAKKEPASLTAYGVHRELKIPFSFDAFPSVANAGLDAVSQSVPAFAYVISARLHVIEQFLGGTSLAVGFEQANGTDIDTDGLVTDANAPVANLVVGRTITGSGAQVGPAANATIGVTGPVSSVVGFPVVTPTGTFTAGKGYISIVYVPANAG